MRPAELCGLRVRSIDFVRNLVSITETLLPVSAYADQRLELVSGPPKTEAGDRTIPIPCWLCDEFAGMLAATGGATGHPDRAGGTVVRQPGGQTPQPRQIPGDRHSSGANRRRPTSQRPRRCDLRHTHASILIDLGANVLAVAQQIGSSDATVTCGSTGTCSPASKNG